MFYKVVLHNNFIDQEIDLSQLCEASYANQALVAILLDCPSQERETCIG